MSRKDIHNFDVPKNLKFSPRDIIAMGGLKCFTKLNPSDFDGILYKGAVKDLTLALEFIPGSDDILVEGKLKGTKETQCTRCLCNFDTEINSEFDKTFSTKEQLIDIMKEVISELALSCEIAEICKSDCRGLCRICGADLNKKTCKCKHEKPSAFSVLKDKLKKPKKGKNKF